MAAQLMSVAPPVIDRMAMGKKPKAQQPRNRCFFCGRRGSLSKEHAWRQSLGVGVESAGRTGHGTGSTRAPTPPDDPAGPLLADRADAIKVGHDMCGSGEKLAEFQLMSQLNLSWTKVQALDSAAHEYLYKH